MNAPPAIDKGIAGVVCSGTFRHVDCFESEAACLAAIEDEDKNTVVMKDDSWIDEVGLCETCGHLASEEPS